MVEYLEPLMEATPETRASLVHEAQASKWLAAAANGHLSEVNNMLTLQEIDPNLTSYAGGGRTAFMLAAEAGHEVCAVLGGAPERPAGMAGYQQRPAAWLQVVMQVSHLAPAHIVHELTSPSHSPPLPWLRRTL